MAPIRFTIFRFVIKRFGRYRGVRPLKQAFDVGLNILTMVTAPSVLIRIVSSPTQRSAFLVRIPFDGQSLFPVHGGQRAKPVWLVAEPTWLYNALAVKRANRRSGRSKSGEGFVTGS